MHYGKLILLFSAVLSLTGCGRLLDKTKHVAEKAVHDSTEILKSAGKGLSEGFTEIDISTDPAVSTLPIKIGNARKIIGEDVISIYVISEDSVDCDLSLFIYDENSTEVGRSSIPLEMETDEARYIDFTFDKRTPFSQAAVYKLERNR